MQSRNFAIVALFMVQLLYGLNYTFAKNVMNAGYVKPFGFVLLRVAGACVLFWLVSLFLPKEKIDKKDFFQLFLAAVFGVFINMLLFLKGLEFTTPIHASTIMTITPIVILILSVFMLNERITKLKILGVIIGFIGALILTLYGQSAREADNVPLGNLMIFLNAVSYSVYVILVKKLTAKYTPLTLIKWLFLFGLILVFPFGFSELRDVQWQTFTPYISWSVVFVVVGATFGTYLLNPMAISKLKASTVGIFIYLQPVIAGLFAISTGADFIDTIKIGAMLLIFLGVYFVSKKTKTTN
ncbi:EamA family transporter [Winogradskyella sp. PC-19]|uniref:DMT family transporter n=1 Tax=unclassified Winogradskyella TaxID=2615021 RepID=UPI000B3BE2C7|nr:MULTISPECIES: DMT family transporter [unclassified Winogradskyella]ARV09557.1 EamA family transporter [Winogradskyella sp. PC-19]RZN83764.1 MAG: DMT family transporter [Winogradskyella sp.]